MNLNRFALVFIVLVVTASPAANTQTTGVPVRVDTAVALKQIMTKVEPPLSPELVAANPGAVLAADLVVRSDGSVESVTLIAGPQGFERALVTALRQWTFKPFNVNGRPARVVTMIDIALPNPQQEAEQRAYADYAEARRACERGLAVKASEVEIVCGRLAAAGDRLTLSRSLERARAFELHGRSLAAAGRNAEALGRFQQAVGAQRQGLRREGVDVEADADLAALMALIAETYVRMRNLKAADEQFASSIAMFERAMVAVPDLRDNYSNRLAGVLQQAAELKRTLGQAAEAKAFEARATRLAR